MLCQYPGGQMIAPKSDARVKKGGTGSRMLQMLCQHLRKLGVGAGAGAPIYFFGFLEYLDIEACSLDYPMIKTIRTRAGSELDVYTSLSSWLRPKQKTHQGVNNRSYTTRTPVIYWEWLQLTGMLMSSCGHIVKKSVIWIWVGLCWYPNLWIALQIERKESKNFSPVHTTCYWMENSMDLTVEAITLDSMASYLERRKNFVVSV
ncbi:hypothetical protein M8C21_014620 [Ambrosia artemisiifolia]|uniref:Uncharacterized protein n=1 Tax=Ambrosia artemisiifolia TaxID=4212 RepID=A0AAD5C2U2_AMBAR|nr:hypothetical protein M8C21_014620 [Ambrosia artemisiifolia]